MFPKAAATAPHQHCAAATCISIIHRALHAQKQSPLFRSAGSLRTHQPASAARRSQSVCGSASSSAATSAIAAPWIEGRNLSRKPKPKSSELLFYTHTLCPYAQRVHMALLEKGVPFQLVHIDLAARPQWFTALSSLVPLVEHPEGTFHRESLDICRWVDAHFDGPELLPAEPQEREAALALLSQGAAAFSSAGLALLGGRTSGSWGISRSHTPDQLSQFKVQLQKLGALLDRHGGPFLLGEQVSLVDLAYFPFAERFSIGALEFCDFDMTAAEGGKIGAWLGAMRSRPHDVSPSADPHLFQEALQRHMRLDFFDYDSYSAAALHPQAHMSS